MRLVHTSDFHLTLEKGKIRGSKEFESIIKYTLENDISHLIIAGDLFENVNPDVKIISFIVRQLRKVSNKGINTLIIKGNHDYKIPNKINELQKVHVFPSNKFTKKEFKEIIFYGRSYNKKVKYPLRDFPKIKSDKPVIGIAHGSYLGKKDSCFTKEDIENVGCDYLALGHYHSFTKIPSKNNAYYCGTPVKGLEYDSKKLGFSLVEIGKKVKVKKIYLE